LACAAFYYVYSDWKLFFLFYSLSATLDIADGHAARALDQCSKFGAILDMVTDRASTSCLIVILATFYPSHALWFCSLIALDIISHFAHIYSSLSLNKKSHKDVSMDQSWLLRIYYTNRFVLGFLCFGNEGFFLHLYLLHFYGGPMVSFGPLDTYLSLVLGSKIALIGSLTLLFYFPIMLIKQLMNVVQLKQALQDIAKQDENDRLKKGK
jgi:CDP-diacylglycerol--inositol 3-phosphatidyltransferase